MIYKTISEGVDGFFITPDELQYYRKALKHAVDHGFKPLPFGMVSDDGKLVEYHIDEALVLARRLKDNWEIGTSSQFCDDPPDWDSATEEEIVKVIVDTLNIKD